MRTNPIGRPLIRSGRLRSGVVTTRGGGRIGPTCYGEGALMAAADHRTWPAGTLLSRLAPTLVERLITLSRPRSFRRHERLIAQGGDDQHALLVVGGVVKVSAVDERGGDAVLALRRRGEMVGELAALTGERRSATVVAVTAVRTRVLPGSLLSAFLIEHPELAREIIRMQAHRLQWANHRRVEFANMPALDRLARTLLDLVEVFADAGPDGRIALSQGELASLVGVRLATAEAALRVLEERGAIRRRYRAVDVIDRPGLGEIAGGSSEPLIPRDGVAGPDAPSAS